MRRMLVGPAKSGKNTIAQTLEEAAEPFSNVANIVYHKKTIVIPDSYLESPWMHKHIIALQQSANGALFLQPAVMQRKSYPPNFAKVFRIPVYGVVTYRDSDSENGCQSAYQQLLEAGVEETTAVNLEKSNELAQLKEYLETGRNNGEFQNGYTDIFRFRSC